MTKLSKCLESGGGFSGSSSSSSGHPSGQCQCHGFDVLGSLPVYETRKLIPGTPRPTIYNWLFQLDDSQSLHRKWLEITKHLFFNGCLGFQLNNLSFASKCDNMARCFRMEQRKHTIFFCWITLQSQFLKCHCLNHGWSTYPPLTYPPQK